MRLLLNSDGVVVDAATATTGTIPLHLAAQSGDTAVASLLLSKSTHQVHIRDNQGRIPLHVAAANGSLDLVTLFLTQGSEINPADNVSQVPQIGIRLGNIHGNSRGNSYGNSHGSSFGNSQQCW